MLRALRQAGSRVGGPMGLALLVALGSPSEAGPGRSLSQIRLLEDSVHFSTYLGGDDADGAFAGALDNESIYLGGFTRSNFYAGDPFESPMPSGELTGDAWVARLSSDGKRVVYESAFGGSGLDYVTDLAVTESGDLVAVGLTYSPDFPTREAMQSSNGGCASAESECAADAFVVRLNADGSIDYATYLGGSGADTASGVTLSNSGRVFISGTTRSSNFPVRRGFQRKLGGDNDAFVVQLSADGSRILSSTFVGGGGNDAATDIGLDDAGHVFITGSTESTDFPRKNPRDDRLGGCCDAFITKLTPRLGDVSYSTYLGGRRADVGRDIAVDGRGRATVAGNTKSPNFETKRAVQSKYNGRGDVFATRLSRNGRSISYSTFLGGGGLDNLLGARLGPDGELLLTGSTRSTTFPTRHSIQQQRAAGECVSSSANCYDAFLSVLAPGGSKLRMSTYLGGAGYEEGWAASASNSRDLYIVGFTRSVDFPTKEAVQPVLMGGSDAFVTKIRR